MTMKFEMARKMGLRSVLIPAPTPVPIPDQAFIHKAEVKSAPDHCPVCGCAVEGTLSNHQCDKKWSDRREDANRDLSYHEALGL